MRNLLFIKSKIVNTESSSRIITRIHTHYTFIHSALYMDGSLNKRHESPL